MASIWLSLPKDKRGPVFITPNVKDSALARGIPRHALKLFEKAHNRRGTANNIFRHHRNLPVEDVALLCASWGDWRILERIHNLGGKATIPHGQGGPGPSLNSWVGVASRVDIMLVPSPYGATALDGINTHIIHGQPKLDRWFNYKPEESEQPTLALSFRWRDSHSAIEHYRPFMARIKEQADEAGIKLLGHGHPLKFDTVFRKFWRDHGIEATPSFEEVLKRAHIYAADCSSSSFEFVGLDRPIVFLSCPAYENMSFGPRFTFGPQAGIVNNDPLNLIAESVLAYQDGEELSRKRRSVADILFKDFKGEASKNAAKALIDFYD